jgi:hypothetical protein
LRAGAKRASAVRHLSPRHKTKIPESAKTRSVSERFRPFHATKYPTGTTQKPACFNMHIRLNFLPDPPYLFQSVSKRFATFH